MSTEFYETNDELVKMATDCEFLEYVDATMTAYSNEYKEVSEKADAATVKLIEITEILDLFPDVKIPSEEYPKAWNVFRREYPEMADMLLLYKKRYDAYIKASAHKHFCMKKMEMLQDAYEKFQAINKPEEEEKHYDTKRTTLTVHCKRIFVSRK